LEQSEAKKSDKINFANRKSSLQKVGEFLREARQSRNLEIEDLASSLRIGQEQLIALENGDENSLPEKVFIKAMIRRIAEKLNLDTSFILDELNEKDTKSTVFIPAVKKELPLKKISLNPIIMIIISGTLGLMTSYLAFKFFNPNQKDSLNQYQKEYITIQQ
tara:strand:+ start:185 stop:670 length:486 start_codon:yes stop_codon:yes gene_type:complete